VEPFPGVVDMVKSLMPKYEVWYYTGRPWAMLDMTIWWLREHGFPMWGSVVMGKFAADAYVDNRAWQIAEKRSAEFCLKTPGIIPLD